MISVLVLLIGCPATPVEAPDPPLLLSQARARVLGVAAGDNAGAAVASLGDFDGDGRPDFSVGAYASDGELGEEGLATVWLGLPADDATLADAPVHLAGTQSQEFVGRALAGLGDVDGDGLGELAVGAIHHSGGGALAGGGVMVLHGSAQPEDGARCSQVGTGFLDHVGMAVAGGDFVGDGRADLWIGAPLAEEAGPDQGLVYGVRGQRLPEELAVDDADVVLVGEDEHTHAGIALASAGDVDGDGLDDLLVGADGLSGSGGAYLVLAPLDGRVALADAGQAWLGEGPGDRAGVAVLGGFDLAGDGRPDPLVGAHKADRGGADGGAVYGLLPPGGGALADAGLVIASAEAEARLGAALAGGDLDGDGWHDLVVGAPTTGLGADWAGGVVVLPGPLVGQVDPGTGLWLVGEARGERAGGAVAVIGDVDNGGLADLVVGAPGRDDGGAESGAAWLWLGEELSW